MTGLHGVLTSSIWGPPGASVQVALALVVRVWDNGERGQRQIKLDQVKRQIRVLYDLQPLCNLTNHRKWFYTNPEEHFLREPSFTQLQNWVTTYEPMIRARARIQHQLNQQGLTAIDEALEHANSLGP
jgi:hypothetical protein